MANNEVNFGTNGMIRIVRNCNEHIVMFMDDRTVVAANITPNLFAKIDAELKFAFRKHTDSRTIEWSDTYSETVSPYNHTIQFKYNKNKGITMIVTTEHLERKNMVKFDLTEENIKSLHNLLVSNLAE